MGPQTEAIEFPFRRATRRLFLGEGLSRASLGGYLSQAFPCLSKGGKGRQV
jgi:hypothetical protein